jgi:hypothetical protein
MFVSLKTKNMKTKFIPLTILCLFLLLLESNCKKESDKKTFTISGRVLNRNTSESIADAQIVLWSDASSDELFYNRDLTYSDEHGSYEFYVKEGSKGPFHAIVTDNQYAVEYVNIVPGTFLNFTGNDIKCTPLSSIVIILRDTGTVKDSIQFSFSFASLRKYKRGSIMNGGDKTIEYIEYKVIAEVNDTLIIHRKNKVTGMETTEQMPFMLPEFDLQRLELFY